MSEPETIELTFWYEGNIVVQHPLSYCKLEHLSIPVHAFNEEELCNPDTQQ